VKTIYENADPVIAFSVLIIDESEKHHKGYITNLSL